MQNTVSEKSSVLKIPPTDESQKQLARILRYPEFLRSPTSSKFLRYVVEETLADRQTYLKAYTIALAVFGKDQAFDPQTDPIVRVQAVRLRKILQKYYLDEGKNDQVVIDLLKGSYIPKIYYNHDREVDLEVPESHTDTAIPSVAIVPFRYLGEDKTQEYFAEGITEEIVEKLSRFNEILVIASHSASRFKDVDIDPKLLGEELDVRFVLMGSMRKANNQIRVTVKLIQTRDSASVWSQSFDKELSVANVISIQDEIAATVASNVAQPYGVIMGKDIRSLERNTTKDLTAYEYFLRYYRFLITISPEDYVWAREGAELATKIDPNYSDAWSALSILYADEHQLGYVDSGIENILDVSFEMVQKALHTGPDNALAYYALLYVSAARNDLQRMNEAGARALEMNPNNALILAEYGSHLTYTGNWDKGLPLIEHAMTVNPFYPDFYHIPFAVYYLNEGQYETALYEIKKINMPEFFWIPLLTAAIYGWLNEKSAAREQLDTLLSLYPGIKENILLELKKWNLTESLIKQILNGLDKAGFNLENGFS